jgi:polyhydroxyalkanoate synthesis repressor PhaR
VSEDTVAPRIIKKYPNRRLYDTESSCYITIAEVRELVVAAVAFVVVEQKTGKDITRSTLLQIILEQELDANPLFSNENLERFIRYYGAGVHGGFSEFIGQSLNFFQDQQREFDQAVKGMADHNPMTFWTEMTQKNMDSWNQMMGLGEKDGEEK